MILFVSAFTYDELLRILENLNYFGRADALICACLALVRCTPVHSLIREATKSHSHLEKLPDLLLVKQLRMKIPSAAAADKIWTGVRSKKYPGNHGNQDDEDKPTMVTDMEKKGKYWLFGVGALLAGYIFFGGQYFEIQMVDDGLDEGEDY